MGSNGMWVCAAHRSALGARQPLNRDNLHAPPPQARRRQLEDERQSRRLAELAPIADAARAAGGVDVAICPPFTLIAAAVTRSGGLIIGAQDIHAHQSGAHTGCVSVPMIREAGARLAIVGHSERRADQHESDEEVRAKAEAALAGGLVAIVCVGESAAERGEGRHLAIVEAMLAGSLPDDWEDGELVVAYEPIWAIGTGKVATPADVAEMHAAIRAVLVRRYGDGASGSGSSTAARSRRTMPPSCSPSPTSTAPWSAAPA